MALILDESFATGIPGSFATARAQAGTLTATYNSTELAVDLSNPTAGQSIWDITSSPLCVSGEAEIDLEFLTDSSTNRAGGLWAVSGAAAVSNGVRLVHDTVTYYLQQWTGGSSWAGSATFETWGQDAPRVFNAAGDRRIFNLRWDFGAGAGVSRATVEGRVDGLLVTRGFAPPAGLASLRPGVMVYASSVRLHSIKAWDAPQAPLAALGARGLDVAVSRRICAPPPALLPGPPAAYNREATLGRRNQYQGGNGRIQGTVKVGGSPNTPVWRRVRLIDESSRQLIGEQWSDAVTGAYDFQNIATERKYSLLSFDHTLEHRAVIADGITPDTMP